MPPSDFGGRSGRCGTQGWPSRKMSRPFWIISSSAFTVAVTPPSGSASASSIDTDMPATGLRPPAARVFGSVEPPSEPPRDDLRVVGSALARRLPGLTMVSSTMRDSGEGAGLAASSKRPSASPRRSPRAAPRRTAPAASRKIRVPDRCRGRKRACGVPWADSSIWWANGQFITLIAVRAWQQGDRSRRRWCVDKQTRHKRSFSRCLKCGLWPSLARGVLAALPCGFRRAAKGGQ